MFVPTSWQPWVALTVSTTNGAATTTTSTTSTTTTEPADTTTTTTTEPADTTTTTTTEPADTTTTTTTEPADTTTTTVEPPDNGTTTTTTTTTTTVPPSGGQPVSVERTAVTPAVTVTPGDRRLSFEWSHPDGRQFQLRTRVTGRNGWSWNPPTTDHGCGAQRSCGWDVV